MKERLRRRRSNPYGSQTTVIIGDPAAAATDYTNPDGPRFQNPPLAGAFVPSRPIPLETKFGRTSGSRLRPTSYRLAWPSARCILYGYGRGSRLTRDVRLKNETDY